jgi:hypothetical protein
MAGPASALDVLELVESFAMLLREIRGNHQELMACLLALESRLETATAGIEAGWVLANSGVQAPARPAADPARDCGV